MNRVKIFEDEFKSRYGKKAIIYRKIEGDISTGRMDKITVKIETEGKRFLLTEYLKKNDTDYVILSHNGKDTRFKSCLEAELKAVELIGEN